MKKLKKYTLLGILFVILTGTLAHFVYQWSGNNFIVGFFVPVSESTWEHMKLCFFPMLLYSIFMNRRLKWEYSCVTSALLAGNLLGTMLIPVIFYTYTDILGNHYLPLDIATFMISVLVAFAMAYRLTLSCRLHAHTTWLAAMVFAMLLFYLVFTYFPPNHGIFAPPG